MMRLGGLLLLFAGSCRSQILFDDFADGQSLHLVSAARLKANVLRLTPAAPDRNGAAWLLEKQPVSAGFDTEFRFRLTEGGGLGHGADGLALVLQNSGPDAIAGIGSSGGWALGDGVGNLSAQGIPLSIAVFFDTFRNENEGDPSNNYVEICTNGKIGEMRWPPARLAMVRKLRVHLKDGKVHTARIVYLPPVLSVHLDGPLVLSAAVDISFVADRDGASYVGFTASTGGGYENHDVLSWRFGGTDVTSNMAMVSSEISFLKAACLPDRNLCTPEQASVEDAGAGRWRVVLPANQPWGASVPGTAVTVTSARGLVCWDLKTRGPDGCGGPAGSGAAGPDFVVPGEKAGALVTQSRGGRVYFSVNDRAGAFADNEGFFEFEVEIRRKD